MQLHMFADMHFVCSDHRQQQVSAGAGRPGHLDAQQPHETSRPSSPLAGITRLLQQHPNLRPPCSPAAEMRQLVCGRMLATFAFAAWLGIAQQKVQQEQLQQQLTWHHVQHVQAGVWNRWRVEFEQRNPKHKLMRAVYRARRYSILSKVGSQHLEHATMLQHQSETYPSMP